MQTSRSFADLVREAVADFSERGFDSEGRLEEWLGRLRSAARAQMMPQAEMEAELRRALGAIYDRLVERGGLLQLHPGVGRFTLQRLRPELRAELQRRITASANLIKLNRERAVGETLQRFSGWATSVPDGGAAPGQRREAATSIRRALGSLPYVERRVAVDQGHKFAASLSAVLALGSGAIAMQWRQHWTRNPRHSHKLRDGRVYVIRGSWAHEAGYVRPQEGSGYLDEITQPGEEIQCLPGDTSIEVADLIEVAYRRWYSGYLTEVITSSGKSLRATPNHPILTRRGWVPIGLLDMSDDVIEISDEKVDLIEKDKDQAVTLISEIFASCLELGIAEQARGRGDQFHGDGAADSNVDVVLAARSLGIGGDVSKLELMDQLILSLTNDSFSRHRSLIQGFFASFLSSEGLVGRLRESLALFRGHLRHSIQHLLGTDMAHCLVGVGGQRFSALFGAPGVACPGGFFRRSQQSMLTEAGHHDVATGTKYSADFLNVSPLSIERCSAGNVDIAGGIAEDRSRSLGFGDSSSDFLRAAAVISIRRITFSGHVYNLQTQRGWYAAGGIIQHNCRCTGVYVNALRQLPPEMLTTKGWEAQERVALRSAA